MSIKSRACFTDKATNGAGEAIALATQQKGFYFSYTVWLFGIWGDGDVTVEVSPDGGATWLPINDDNGDTLLFVSDTVMKLTVDATHVRGTIGNAGGGTSLTMLVTSGQNDDWN